MSANEGIEKTPQLLKQLIQKSFEAKENAYSPYSKFRVGAALLTESGEIITGKYICTLVYYLWLNHGHSRRLVSMR